MSLILIIFQTLVKFLSSTVLRYIKTLSLNSYVCIIDEIRQLLDM